MNMLKCTPAKGTSSKLKQALGDTVKRTLFVNAAAPADDTLLKMSSSIRTKIKYQLHE
jgi:hypothetical protein